MAVAPNAVVVESDVRVMSLARGVAMVDQRPRRTKESATSTDGWMMLCPTSRCGTLSPLICSSPIKRCNPIRSASASASASATATATPTPTPTPTQFLNSTLTESCHQSIRFRDSYSIRPLRFEFALIL
jgi:hypothetical protein